MKKFLCGLFAFVLSASLLAGCQSPAPTDTAASASTASLGDTQANQPEDGRIKIGVSFASEAQYRFKFDKQIMEQKAEELGADIIFQYANYDATKQANQVENLISQGIDVLVLNVVSGNMVNLVEKVRSQGIPVITFDNTVEGAQVDLNVDRDNVKVGRLQLEAALEYMGPEGGNVVLVKGDPGSAVAQRISQGYEAVAAEHPELNIVADQFHEGVMTMSIWTDIVSGDQRTIEAAVKLGKGEEITPDEIQQIGGFDIPVLLVDVMPVTKDNLRQWLDEIAPAGWATEEEIFG